MAGLVKAEKRDEALQILKSMTNGVYGHGIVPGVNVYNALVMSRVVSGEWHDALLVYDTMRKLNVTPDKTTMQGLLIACNRIGDRTRTLGLVTELFASKMTMDKHCFDHCLRVIMPKEVRASSLGEVRTKLRTYGTRHSRMKQASTSLGRLLRIAEVEEERQESGRISERDIQERREKAWRDVLEQMLEFAQALQE